MKKNKHILGILAGNLYEEFEPYYKLSIIIFFILLKEYIVTLSLPKLHMDIGLKVITYP